jgi:biopolymer transport protein ExbB
MKTMTYCLLLFAWIYTAPLQADTVKRAPAKTIETPTKGSLQNFDIKKVYLSSPVIYSILLLMSTSALAIWLYTQATFRMKEIVPETFLNELKKQLGEKKYNDALAFCRAKPNLLGSIISVGLSTRHLGSQVMTDAMKSEGKRVTAPFWQRLAILNDIAIIAPMLGLLGTVIGMFYAFYDVNRSVESINAVFDGLGVSVGTTVMGLVVAILSMILATTLKYRLLKNFSLIENEALALSVVIETK